jgi:hypothetical protein
LPNGAHVLERLRRQVDLSGDPVLTELRRELHAYPTPSGDVPTGPAKVVGEPDVAGVAVPLRLVVGDHTLSFLSTTTIFGTPLDVTLSELAIESFFPADAATGEALRRMGV